MVRTIIPAALVLVLLAGCAKDRDGIQSLSGSESQELNAQQSRFERSEDPPIQVQTHLAAAQLAEAHGQYPQAIVQYNAALKLDPKHRASLFALAVLQTRLKAFPDAIATWECYVEATGNDAGALANLGYCHELAGNAAQAEQAYQRGITSNPQNQACRVNFGLMLARAGRLAEATVQLQQVLPEAQVYYNIGSVLEGQGRRIDAREHYRKALQADPQLLEAQTRLASLE